VIKAYKITYLSPASILRSFTLFGAICWSYRLLYGKEALEDFLANFVKSPKFLISSAFPYINDQFIFPKPILPIRGESQDFKLKFQRKNFKKASYVTLDILKKVIEGKIRYEEDYANYKVKSGIIKEENTDIKLGKTIHTQVRNLINRVSHRSENLFFIESTIKTYEEFFLVYLLNDNFDKELEGLLKLIEEIGVGANKNIGWGKIKIEEIKHSSLEGIINLKAEQFVSLSPVIPTNNIDQDKSYYDIETFKNYTENTFEKEFLKKKVLYLKEGSFIVKKDQENFVGTIKEVGNNIFQYGLEFPLGVAYA
jgi:CRISPR-associated RAMP protein, Csm4 family